MSAITGHPVPPLESWPGWLTPSEASAGYATRLSSAEQVRTTGEPTREHVLHPSASALLDVLFQREGMKLLNETQILAFSVVMGKHMC